MLNILTKKRVLQMSLLGIMSLILILLLRTYFNVPSNIGGRLGVYNPPLISRITQLSLYLLDISIPILLFSLATYRMKEEVFLSWRKFTVIYLFTYLFIVVIVPWTPAAFSPFSKGPNTLFMLSFYFLISLTLTSYKSIE